MPFIARKKIIGFLLLGFLFLATLASASTKANKSQVSIFNLSFLTILRNEPITHHPDLGQISNIINSDRHLPQGAPNADGRVLRRGHRMPKPIKKRPLKPILAQ